MRQKIKILPNVADIPCRKGGLGQRGMHDGRAVQQRGGVVDTQQRQHGCQTENENRRSHRGVFDGAEVGFLGTRIRIEPKPAKAAADSKGQLVHSAQPDNSGGPIVTVATDR